MADTMEQLARAHGVSLDAVRTLRDAVRRGGGRQAQFSHPELGGMGQWQSGGMTQVGDMFNTALKDKVRALCAALAELPDEAADAGAGSHGSADWWPRGLGQPSSSGAQNGVRYACFPDARRVAVEQDGRVTVYDSGAHRISGVSQQQGGARDLAFHSQLGTVRVSDMPEAT